MRTRKQIERRGQALLRRRSRRERRKEDADARDVVLREREQRTRLDAGRSRPSKLARELAVLRREYAALVAELQRRS